MHSPHYVRLYTCPILVTVREYCTQKDSIVCSTTSCRFLLRRRNCLAADLASIRRMSDDVWTRKEEGHRGRKGCLTYDIRRPDPSNHHKLTPARGCWCCCCCWWFIGGRQRSKRASPTRMLIDVRYITTSHIPTHPSLTLWY